MMWLGAALVCLGLLGLVGFRAWLKARYPEPYTDADHAWDQQQILQAIDEGRSVPPELQRRVSQRPDLGQRVAALEERLSTLELQRAILRKVPDK